MVAKVVADVRAVQPLRPVVVATVCQDTQGLGANITALEEEVRGAAAQGAGQPTWTTTRDVGGQHLASCGAQPRLGFWHKAVILEP